MFNFSRDSFLSDESLFDRNVCPCLYLSAAEFKRSRSFMKETRVDMREPHPERQAEILRTNKVLWKLNHTMP